MRPIEKELSYFPGCSLATTAKENSETLISFLARFDIDLTEIPDWNCCGSSSAHSVNPDLALSLAARNLFLAPESRPLLIACPGCYLRLSQARMTLQEDEEKRKIHETMMDTPFPEDLQLMAFFELLSEMGRAGWFKGFGNRLKGLKIAAYYGCMLARPPRMRSRKTEYGLMESTLSALGAGPVRWPFATTCCGTFLSVSKPAVSGKLVHRIMEGAIRSDAECIVTACAMCHLNLEIRSLKGHRLPVFHFSELLALALGMPISRQGFKRHLIDPVPVIKQRELFPVAGDLENGAP